MNATLAIIIIMIASIMITHITSATRIIISITFTSITITITTASIILNM